jgi:hypothetical protein
MNQVNLRSNGRALTAAAAAAVAFSLVSHCWPILTVGLMRQR